MTPRRADIPLLDQNRVSAIRGIHIGVDIIFTVYSANILLFLHRAHKLQILCPPCN